MDGIGIISYGSDIPRYRIKVDEIASVWGKDGGTIARGLGISEKSVPSTVSGILIPLKHSRQCYIFAGCIFQSGGQLF